MGLHKVTAWLKEEIIEVIPPAIFFIITFHIIAITRALMLEQYGIKATTVASATIAAHVVAKVVLIVDMLPFINRFPEEPLIYNTTWKTFIYILAALLVRFLEHWLPLLWKYASLPEATRHLWQQVQWPHFWAIHMWLLVLFFVYCGFRELVRALGRREVIDMFFRRKPAWDS
jgi:hypothetical protein